MSDERRWTVLDLIRWTADHFASRGIESPRLDAECLLAHALGTTRLKLYLDFEKPVAETERAPFRELVRRRADDRVPVALLLGSKEFWSLALEVGADVLVPRPETETLVELALQQAETPEDELTIVDVGTGSGAIAIALATELPKARLTAIDISPGALEVAQRNAETHGVAGRIRFLEGDGFGPVRGERFDLVLANPPYIAERDQAQLPPELGHEPRAALFSGADGTELLSRLVDEASAHIAGSGFVAFEAGTDQTDWLAGRFAQAGLAEISIHRDAAARPRVVSASSLGESIAGPQAGGNG